MKSPEPAPSTQQTGTTTASMRLHHIGYAVKNIRSYLDEYLIPMFSPIRISEPVADPIQQVVVCFCEMQGGSVIELIEPMGEKSPVNSLIGSKRGGLYHLCYEVEDLDREVQRFRQKRYMPLGKPVPAAAFEGRRIVFLLSPQQDVVEFVERPR